LSLSQAKSSLFHKKSRVLLTGASRGIGLAIRREFEAHGLEVVTPTREECDLSNSDSIAAYIKKNPTLEVDILINNAGINFPERMEKLDLDKWTAAMQVNLTAPYLLSQHFAKSMCKQGWGRIVNISSVFSLVTKEGRAVYSASKSALNGLTRTCAVEWGLQGVLVNSILPGYIDTDLTRQNNTPAALEKIVETIPVGRMAMPEEIAKMVVFLSSEMNTYLTGQSVVVDGGFSLR
jgi:3-oxoacyl-[acyl-carrier protein] reductase